MDRLLQHFKDIYEVGGELQEELQSRFRQVSLQKGDYLIQEGKICRKLYFLEQGCLRGFYNLDGKEVTHWFGFENDFVTSFHSFITQQPAVENIQLMEDALLWSMSKDQLNAMLAAQPKAERLLRMVYEQYYIRLEQRYVNAQFKTAAELYDDLLAQAPHILERVPLGIIASYLGISQETLSRVRSRLTR